MANQQTTAKVNWQHGQVYLTSSKDKAVQYGKNKYGSELISNTLNLFTELDRPSEFQAEDHPVLGLLEKPTSPLHITISSIPLEYLCDEMGNPADAAIKKHEQFYENADKSQQLFPNALNIHALNFRLTSPLQIKILGEHIVAKPHHLNAPHSGGKAINDGKSSAWKVAMNLHFSTARAFVASILIGVGIATVGCCRTTLSAAAQTSPVTCAESVLATNHIHIPKS